MRIQDRSRATATSIALTLGLLCGTATSVHANDGDGDSDDRVAFVRTNLISNIDGRARVTDAHLQNAWGIAFAPGSPFWVNANHAGVATLYAGDGSIVNLVVTIPPPPGSPTATVAAPTGMIWNPTTGFLLPGSTFPAIFIFDTEDGTVSGWNPNVSSTNAVIAVDNSAAHANSQH